MQHEYPMQKWKAQSICEMQGTAEDGVSRETALTGVNEVFHVKH